MIFLYIMREAKSASRENVDIRTMIRCKTLVVMRAFTQ